jgi:hypothetical protein
VEGKIRSSWGGELESGGDERSGVIELELLTLKRNDGFRKEVSRNMYQLILKQSNLKTLDSLCR